MYFRDLLPRLVKAGDDGNYGSAAVCDSLCLQVWHQNFAMLPTFGIFFNRGQEILALYMNLSLCFASEMPKNQPNQFSVFNVDSLINVMDHGVLAVDVVFREFKILCKTLAFSLSNSLLQCEN